MVDANEKNSHHTQHVPYHRNRIVLVVSVIGAFLALFVFSQMLGTDYTGYVNVDINTVSVGEMAFDGTRFIISSLDDQIIPMNAARISGKIYGPGTVKVYLANGDKRLLVFSNSDQPGTASPLIEPAGRVSRVRVLDKSTFGLPGQQEQNFELDVIEDQSKLFDVSVYGESYRFVKAACTETCGLRGKLDSNRYVFVFEMDPGTAFEVTNIGFT
jgi:hypothetical protein